MANSEQLRKGSTDFLLAAMLEPLLKRERGRPIKPDLSTIDCRRAKVIQMAVYVSRNNEVVPTRRKIVKILKQIAADSPVGDELRELFPDRALETSVCRGLKRLKELGISWEETNG